VLLQPFSVADPIIRCVCNSGIRCSIVMTRYIENIDISFLMLIYRIVSSKKSNFSICRDIQKYCDIVDNMTISTVSLLHCMIRKKDYKWSELIVS